MRTQLSYKVCPECTSEKRADEFYKDNSKSSRLTTYCKECDTVRRRRYVNRYYPNNKGSAKIKYKSIKSNCPRRKIEFNLDKSEFISWYDNQEKKCYFCGRQLANGKRGGDGLTIDRLDNHVGYEMNNIVLCCWRCNIVKGQWFTAQEMMEIAHKYLKGRD